MKKLPQLFYIHFYTGLESFHRTSNNLQYQCLFYYLFLFSLTCSTISPNFDEKKLITGYYIRLVFGYNVSYKWRP